MQHIYPSDVIVRTELPDIQWRMDLQLGLWHNVHMRNIGELL